MTTAPTTYAFLKSASLAAAVLAVLAIAAMAGGTARAATFVAEVDGHKMTVYSTSKKKEACTVKNTFSYVVEGVRYTRTQTCNVDVLPGEHLEVCKVQADDLNQTKIEKPVEVVSCQDAK